LARDSVGLKNHQWDGKLTTAKSLFVPTAASLRSPVFCFRLTNITFMVIIRKWNSGRIIAGKKPFSNAVGIVLEAGYQYDIFLSGIRFLHTGQQTVHRKAVTVAGASNRTFLNRDLPNKTAHKKGYALFLCLSVFTLKFWIYISNNTNAFCFIPVIRKSLEHELQFIVQLAVIGKATFCPHWRIKKLQEYELQNYSQPSIVTVKLHLVCLRDPEEICLSCQTISHSPT
jgi:hypothetical protein